MDKVVAFMQKYNVWYHIVYMMVGLERYPMTKQIVCWFYLDTKVVHPDILWEARTLYTEEAMSSFKNMKVFN